MKRPVRTTIVFALAGGFLVVPITMLLSAYLGWTAAFKLSLWADMTIYAVLLARWSRTRLLSVVFPVILLLGTALWPHSYAVFCSAGSAAESAFGLRRFEPLLPK